jgi:hypothetical protein
MTTSETLDAARARSATHLRRAARVIAVVVGGLGEAFTVCVAMAAVTSGQLPQLPHHWVALLVFPAAAVGVWVWAGLAWPKHRPVSSGHNFVLGSGVGVDDKNQEDQEGV